VNLWVVLGIGLLVALGLAGWLAHKEDERRMRLTTCLKCGRKLTPENNSGKCVVLRNGHEWGWCRSCREIFRAELEAHLARAERLSKKVSWRES
jgi:hypothetical protein